MTQKELELVCTDRTQLNCLASPGQALVRPTTVSGIAQMSPQVIGTFLG